jgi:hypothetical protein
MWFARPAHIAFLETLSARQERSRSADLEPLSDAIEDWMQKYELE